MNFEEYKSLALKTEAPLPTLNFNLEALLLLLQFGVRAADLMDQVKKTLIYGKKLNYGDFVDRVSRIEETLSALVSGGPGIAERDACLDILPVTLNLTEPNRRITHGVIGMFGESGEMLEALCRQMVSGQLDLVNMGEETGDSDWYKTIIHDETGVSEESSREANIAKLKKRYAGKFSKEAALSRDLVGERAVLENGMSKAAG